MGVFDNQQSGLQKLMMLKQLAGGQGGEAGIDVPLINAIESQKQNDANAITRFNKAIESATTGDDYLSAAREAEGYQQSTGRQVFAEGEIFNRSGGLGGKVAGSAVAKQIDAELRDPDKVGTGKILMAARGMGSTLDNSSDLFKKFTKMGVPGLTGMTDTVDNLNALEDEHYETAYSNAKKEAYASIPDHIKAGRSKDDYDKDLFLKVGATEMTRNLYNGIELAGGMVPFAKKGGHQAVDEQADAMLRDYPKSETEIEKIRARQHKQLDDKVKGVRNENTDNEKRAKDLKSNIYGFFPGGSRVEEGFGATMKNMDANHLSSANYLFVHGLSLMSKDPTLTVSEATVGAWVEGIKTGMLDNAVEVSGLNEPTYWKRQTASKEYMKQNPGEGAKYGTAWVDEAMTFVPGIYDITPGPSHDKWFFQLTDGKPPRLMSQNDYERLLGPAVFEAKVAAAEEKAERDSTDASVKSGEEASAAYDKDTAKSTKDAKNKKDKDADRAAKKKTAIEDAASKARGEHDINKENLTKLYDKLSRIMKSGALSKSEVDSLKSLNPDYPASESFPEGLMEGFKKNPTQRR